MAYAITDQLIGAQAITETDTTQRHPLGTIVRATDPDLGEGEFIYLKGVASTVVGSWVHYNRNAHTTALVVPNAIGPVAVAMSANDAATSFGWYQISGLGSARSADVDSNPTIYIDTAAGVADTSVVAGDKIHNASFVGPDDTATTRAPVMLQRPFTTDESS